MSETDLIPGKDASDEGTTYSDIPAEGPEKETRELADDYPTSKPWPITIRAKIIP